MLVEIPYVVNKISHFLANFLTNTRLQSSIFFDIFERSTLMNLLFDDLQSILSLYAHVHVDKAGCPDDQHIYVYSVYCVSF